MGGFPGGPGVAPPMPPPLPLQQPSASGSGQSPRRPPEDPLTLSALANASPTLQKNMIGERLYPLIHHSQPELAGKITGMLLEMDNSPFPTHTHVYAPACAQHTTAVP